MLNRRSVLGLVPGAWSYSLWSGRPAPWMMRGVSSSSQNESRSRSIAVQGSLPVPRLLPGRTARSGAKSRQRAYPGADSPRTRVPAGAPSRSAAFLPDTREPFSGGQVGEADGSQREGLRTQHLQTERMRQIFEERLAAPKHDRMHYQMVLVDETCTCKGPGKHRAAPHQDILPGLLFQVCDLFRRAGGC